MPQRQHRLDQTGDAGRRVQMADVGLERPDGAIALALGALAKRLRERLDFNRISDLGSSAVRLHIRDIAGPHSRHSQSFVDNFGLSIDARREIPDFSRAVVVDRRSKNDSVNCVTISQGVFESPQHHNASAARKYRAAGIGVEGAAVSVARQNLAFAI